MVKLTNDNHIYVCMDLACVAINALLLPIVLWYVRGQIVAMRKAIYYPLPSFLPSDDAPVCVVCALLPPHYAHFLSHILGQVLYTTAYLAVLVAVLAHAAHSMYIFHTSRSPAKADDLFSTGAVTTIQISLVRAPSNGPSSLVCLLKHC